MTPDQSAPAAAHSRERTAPFRTAACRVAIGAVLASVGLVPALTASAGAQVPTTVVVPVTAVPATTVPPAPAEQPVQTPPPSDTAAPETTAPPVTAAAKPNEAGLTTKVSVGAGTRVVWGGPIPVRVSITAQRLFHGSLRVDAEVQDQGWTSPVHANLEVEIAGGATKEFRVEMPFILGRMASRMAFEGGMNVDPMTGELIPGPLTLPTVKITATVFTDDGKKADVQRANGAGSPLGSVCILGNSGPPRGSLPPEGFVAQPDATPLSLLRVETDGWTPQVITGCGQLVVSPEIAARLSKEWTTGLLSWTEQGGRLVIDGEPADSPANFPPAFQAGGAEQIFGIGRVSFSHGLARSGEWSRVLVAQPNSISLQNTGEPDNFSQLVLATLMDFSIPGTKAVVIGVLLYIALVGPILFLVLAKLNKQVWAWWLIPVIALVATAGTVGVSKVSRRDDRAARINLVTLGDQAATVRSWIGIPRVGSSIPEVRLTAGASLLDSAESLFRGPMAATSKIAFATDPAGTDVEANVSENGFAELKTRMAAKPAGRIQVELTRDPTNGELDGTVKNTTAWDLRDVRIMSDGLDVGLKSLAAGASAPIHFKPAKTMKEQFEDQQMGNLSVLLMSRLFSWDRPGPQAQRLAKETPVALIIAAAADGEAAINAVENVEVWAWTDDKVPSPLASDQEVADGPSMIVDRQHLDSLEPLPYSVVADSTRNNGMIAATDNVIRFDAVSKIPDPERTGILIAANSLTVPAVWDGTKWVDLVNGGGLPRREPPGGLTEETTPSTEVEKAVPLEQPAASSDPGAPFTVPDSTTTTTTAPSNTPNPAAPAGLIDPRPVTAWPSNLSYGSLNLWIVPINGWRDGHLYIKASNLSTWMNPMPLVEVPK